MCLDRILEFDCQAKSMEVRKFISLEMKNIPWACRQHDVQQKMMA